MSKDKGTLDQVHGNTMRFVFEQLEQSDPQIIASTMLAIAVRLYKTILTPQDFERFMTTVSEESGNVEPFHRPSIN